MIEFTRLSGRALVGAMALLIAGAAAAPAQMASPAPAAPAAMQTPMSKMPPPGLLKLSDTITLRAGTCWLVSAGGDVERPPEKPGPQRCVFRDVIPMATAYVPGNKDEYIIFQYSIAADGTITGTGREGMNQGAYSCTIVGKTKPGTKHGQLMKAGAIIRVMEIPSLP